MISFKRYMHIILIIVSLSGIFLIYTIHESRPASVQNLTSSAVQREFTEMRRVDEGDRPGSGSWGIPKTSAAGNSMAASAGSAGTSGSRWPGRAAWMRAGRRSGISLFSVTAPSAAGRTRRSSRPSSPEAAGPSWRRAWLWQALGEILLCF